MVDSVSVRLKTLACRKNAFKHSYLQWNAGTACVSECRLKTLACQGLCVGPSNRYRPKGVFGKASAIARMRQKCVRNASEMRQNGSFFLRKEERSKCVRNASKLRQKRAEHLWGRTPFRRCPSTVSCTVLSGESPNFRWILS